MLVKPVIKLAVVRASGVDYSYSVLFDKALLYVFDVIYLLFAPEIARIKRVERNSFFKP